MRLLRREPAQAFREIDHSRLRGRLVGIARELEVAVARRPVFRDFVESRGSLRRVPRLRRQRRRVALEVVEEHPHLGHVAAQKVVDERELLRDRQPIVGEMADVGAEARMRIDVGEPARHRHAGGREETDELAAHLAGRDFIRGRRLEVALQQRPGGAPERGLRREAVEHRHVLEDVAHPVAVALAVPLAQQPREPLGVGGRLARAHEAARDLRRCAAHGFRVERVAAEEIDLLQLREHARARIAARRRARARRPAGIRGRRADRCRTDRRRRNDRR